MTHLGNAILLAVVCFPIWILIKQLRVKHASSVYLVWYLFSLAGFATGLVLWWSLAAGAIDQHGNGSNSWGKLVMRVILISVNPADEFEWLIALVGLIVVPQLTSYGLSGISGCAVRPRLVSLCVNFLSLSFAKTFAIASGVIFGIAALGACHRLQGVDTAKVFQYMIAAAGLVLFAFLALTAKTALEEWPLVANHPRMARVRETLAKLDRAMTRHSQVTTRG